MLTCQQVTELVTEYLEGRQSLIQRLRFQMHLGMCGHCRAYLRQMRMTVLALNSLPSVSAPPEMTREVLERFQRWNG